MPACFQKFHAPFTWGKSALDSVKNSVALEVCAEMAMGTWTLRPEAASLAGHLLDKPDEKLQFDRQSDLVVRHAGRRHLSGESLPLRRDMDTR